MTETTQPQQPDGKPDGAALSINQQAEQMLANQLAVLAHRFLCVQAEGIYPDPAAVNAVRYLLTEHFEARLEVELTATGLARIAAFVVQQDGDEVMIRELNGPIGGGVAIQ